MPLLRRVECATERETGQRNSHSDRQSGSRQPTRPVLSPAHFSRLALHFAAQSCNFDK